MSTNSYGLGYEKRAQFRNAMAISAPHENLFSGFLASAFARTVSMLGGIPARRCDIGAGFSDVIFVIRTAILLA